MQVPGMFFPLQGSTPGPESTLDTEHNQSPSSPSASVSSPSSTSNSSSGSPNFTSDSGNMHLRQGTAALRRRLQFGPKPKKENLEDQPRQQSKKPYSKKQHLSPAEADKKREMNRLYAQKSRQKRSLEFEDMKMRCTEQEAIIEIYKKMVNIFYTRQSGTSPVWVMKSLKWFPSQGSRHKTPVTVECFLPECDEKFYSELGNNAYGKLQETKSEAKTTVDIKSESILPQELAEEPRGQFTATEAHGCNNHQPVLTVQTAGTSRAPSDSFHAVTLSPAQTVGQNHNYNHSNISNSSYIGPIKNKSHHQRFAPYQIQIDSQHLKVQGLPPQLCKLISSTDQGPAADQRVMLISDSTVVCDPTHDKVVFAQTQERSVNEREMSTGLVDSRQQNDIINAEHLLHAQAKPKVMTTSTVAENNYSSNVTLQEPQNFLTVSKNHYLIPTSQLSMGQVNATIPSCEAQAKPQGTRGNQNQSREILSHPHVKLVHVRRENTFDSSEDQVNESKNKSQKEITPVSGAECIESDVPLIVSTTGLPTIGNIPAASLLFDANHILSLNTMAKPSSELHPSNCDNTEKTSDVSIISLCPDPVSEESHKTTITPLTESYQSLGKRETKTESPFPSTSDPLQIKVTPNVSTNACTELILPINSFQHVLTDKNMDDIALRNKLTLGTVLRESKSSSLFPTSSSGGVNTFCISPVSTSTLMASCPSFLTPSAPPNTVTSVSIFNSSASGSPKLTLPVSVETRPALSNDGTDLLNMISGTSGLSSLSSFDFEGDLVEFESLKPTIIKECITHTANQG